MLTSARQRSRQCQMHLQVRLDADRIHRRRHQYPRRDTSAPTPTRGSKVNTKTRWRGVSSAHKVKSCGAVMPGALREQSFRIYIYNRLLNSLAHHPSARNIDPFAGNDTDDKNKYINLILQYQRRSIPGTERTAAPCKKTSFILVPGPGRCTLAILGLVGRKIHVLPQ